VAVAIMSIVASILEDSMARIGIGSVFVSPGSSWQHLKWTRLCCCCLCPSRYPV
jgi:hypothetical protein